jgi:ABC-2 type transport system ATP-binding protein
MDELAIQCNHITFRYQTGNTALNNITLNLEKGKVHVILGPNGAGKTTFLRIATTELIPTRGAFKVLGYDVKKHREQIVRKIGVMPQQALLYKQLTAWEHVYFFTLLKGYSKAESKSETERVLKLLNLFERCHEELDSFSEGMINSINLAQAIAGDSELLFLDEPTVGFDPQRRRIIWDYIREIRGIKTIILTTQYLDEAHELADNIIIFNKGQIIHHGDVKSALEKLDYQLKLEIPKSEVNLITVRKIDKKNYSEQEDKIVLWVQDGRKAVQQLIEANIDLSSVNFQRPMLEEAYLGIIDE